MTQRTITQGYIAPTVFSASEIARYIGVSPEAVKQWENNGLLPSSSRVGRRKKRVWSKSQTLAILTYARDILNYPIPARVFGEVEQL